jgi:hypothetical protein
MLGNQLERVLAALRGAAAVDARASRIVFDAAATTA